MLTNIFFRYSVNIDNYINYVYLFVFCNGVGQSMKKKMNKHCKVSALLTAVLVTSTCSCLWGSSVYGETPITDANGNTYLASDNTILLVKVIQFQVVKMLLLWGIIIQLQRHSLETMALL